MAAVMGCVNKHEELLLHCELKLLNIVVDFINIMPTEDWQTLTKLTGGANFQIERVRLVEQDVAIEGRFEVPPLAALAAEDQIFVAAFVRCHGSIKQMERFFGVSYPTIKNRLNRIGALLPFAEITPEIQQEPAAPATSELLSRLERGEMTVADVLGRLGQVEDER